MNMLSVVRLLGKANVTRELVMKYSGTAYYVEQDSIFTPSSTGEYKDWDCIVITRSLEQYEEISNFCNFLNTLGNVDTKIKVLHL